MTALVGIGVSHGVATGRVVRLASLPTLPEGGVDPPVPGLDAAAETRRAVAALEAVALDLELRSEGREGPAADVLGAEVLMARDPALADGIAEHAARGADALGALLAVLAEARAGLVTTGDALADRVVDLDDLRDRAGASLLGTTAPSVPDPGHPFVLVARDLSPADAAVLDPDRVVAVVTERGAPATRTSSLARSLGIPTVVACAAAVDLVDGQVVVVDGDAGWVTPDPSAGELAEVAARLEARAARRARRSGPGRTADAHAVKLLVSVDAPGEVAAAAAVDSEGLGVLRSERLFPGVDAAPGQDEQEAAYRTVFRAFTGRTVVVRTFDVRSVGPAAGLHGLHGLRGLRAARRDPEGLAAQLQALARAAKDTGADLCVVGPMVATPAEAAGFVQVARLQGLDRVGVVVAVPAAALRAGDLLAEVDMVSVAIDELAQLTFAADPGLPELADLLDPWQPAVLELLAGIARAGRGAGRPVSMCVGDAGDPLLALVLAGLGATSLSMAPRGVAAVRDALAAHSLDECRVLAELALAAPTAEEARAAVADASE